MKKCVLIYFSFISLVVGAVQVPQEPVFTAEDVANQSAIVVQNDREVQQCQAVRIAPQWYLTAAHCVYPFCAKECSITVQLLQGNLQAQAVLYHSQEMPRVFVPAAYYPGTGKSIRSDVALLGFDPAEEDYFFYEVRDKKELDRASFEKYLKKAGYEESREQWQALQKARPTLWSVTNSVSRKLVLPIAVPDLRSDGIYIREQINGGFYYFTELRHYLGPNFGIEKGMSGSGVIFPGGAVVGVVSASLSNESTLVIYNEKDEPVRTLPYSSNYFMFTPISRENKSFIEATAKSYRHRFGVEPKILPIHTSYAQQTSQRVQEVFGELHSSEEVISARER